MRVELSECRTRISDEIPRFGFNNNKMVSTNLLHWSAFPMMWPVHQLIHWMMTALAIGSSISLASRDGRANEENEIAAVMWVIVFETQMAPRIVDFPLVFPTCLVATDLQRIEFDKNPSIRSLNSQLFAALTVAHQNGNNFPRKFHFRKDEIHEQSKQTEISD